MNTISVGNQMKPSTELKPCAGENCFEIIEVPIIELFSRKMDFRVLCDSCEEKYRQEIERKDRQERIERFKNAFDAICPPLYRNTDLGRIYGPFAETAMNYQFNPTGVLFEGPPGTGKTRAAWHILKRMVEAGKSCYGLTSTQFAKFAADQWHSNAEDKGIACEAMERCRRTSVLLIDDLGKQKMTDRSELELYDVLEWRTTNLKPTIITTNATGEQLKKMLSEDRRNAILRRIRDFSQFIKFNA